MDNTVQALQNLYVALGGEQEAVANIVTIPDMINAIADLKTTTSENTEESVEEKEGK